MELGQVVLQVVKLKKVTKVPPIKI